MDIPDISGVTVLSTSSLQSVSEWYTNMDVDETRKRFRATIEIDGVPAFWEDHLFSKEGDGIEFKVGDVTMFGMSPGQGALFQRVTLKLVRLFMRFLKRLQGIVRKASRNGLL